MLILQGMGEFRASLISSATAYHPEPERERQGERSERERGWGWERKWENWGKGSGRLETGRRRGENHQSINTQMRTASHPKRNSGTIKKNPQRSDEVDDQSLSPWTSSASPSPVLLLLPVSLTNFLLLSFLHTACSHFSFPSLSFA